MKITIWVELGDSSSEEFHSFKGIYEDVETAYRGLERLIENAEKLENKDEKPKMPFPSDKEMEDMARSAGEEDEMGNTRLV